MLQSKQSRAALCDVVEQTEQSNPFVLYDGLGELHFCYQGNWVGVVYDAFCAMIMIENPLPMVRS